MLPFAYHPIRCGWQTSRNLRQKVSLKFINTGGSAEMAELSVKDKTKSFFGGFKLRRFEKGQILVFGGDDPQYVYYLEKGSVRQYDVSYRGDEIVLNVFKEGAFFPMSWATLRTPNPFYFQSATIVEARLADPGATVAFIKENPDVMFDLLCRVYSGTSGILQRMTHLVGGSAKSRVMFEILLDARRFGESHEDGSIVVTANEIELAGRAGLTRETVSREISKLRRDQLIHTNDNKLVITNVQSFQQKLGTVL